MGFSLEKFEAYAYSRDHEMALRELVSFLEILDSNYGLADGGFSAEPLRSMAQEMTEEHVLTRTAAAISCLLSDRTLHISEAWQKHILTMHRWIGAIFSSTPFCNADHVMRALNLQSDKSDLKNLILAKEDLFKFCLLYTPDSEVALDLDALLESNKQLALGLGSVLISPRFLGSPLAHSKREQLLPWMTAHLDQIDDIEKLPVGVLHDLYMHCSYADRSDKHDIKKPINRLICRKLEANGVLDRDEKTSTDVSSLSGDGKKPIMLVVLEWFGSSHSIYRTHSRTIESARRHFHIIGMGYEHCVDETTKKVFDEFIPIDMSMSVIDQLRQISAQAEISRASICYMPSVGMFPLTMWLANLRVAPLQIMALGHPATTHAHAIDYVVVEEDYMGSESCFSEKLLKLPKDGMPYRPSASARQISGRKNTSMEPAQINIVICATTMKLNPEFLGVCKRIVEKSQVPIHYKFLVGQAQGLVYPNVKRVIQMFLGDNATAYPHQGYEGYMNVIGQCDMFINPFPFGNTNGIIDTIGAGLIGVCKTGPEVHEHIDQGLFERLGLPDWLVAKNVDEYIAAAVRLAENHSERVALSDLLAGPEKVQVLFNGRPEIFGDLLIERI